MKIINNTSQTKLDIEEVYKCIDYAIDKVFEAIGNEVTKKQTVSHRYIGDIASVALSSDCLLKKLTNEQVDFLRRVCKTRKLELNRIADFLEIILAFAYGAEFLESFYKKNTARKD